MTEPTDALLPCPFCGSADATLSDDLITFYGECLECGATGSYSSYRSGAIAAWNRRTPAPVGVEPLIPFRHGCKWCGKTTGCKHTQKPAPAGKGDGFMEAVNEMDALYEVPPAPATQQAGVALSDDLRDRLVAISEAIADQDDRAAQAMLREILKAPQPSPTAQAAQADSVQEDAARYRWLAEHCRSTSEHWGGRWSIVVEGPAPKSHDSEDDFDAAIDAGRKQGEK